ncbi:cbb3-type cytochrome c oxidase subunit I [Thioclava atlantica]|uniref:Cytochrome-c oxidase n=1 Tax=Thioclava atlantica TaxID=1317124 RepID=A0A085TV37_9RHOB|nr:cbb3-type cytochrome c oxidase subunit I [Thioclava atlantica]KFE34584.1 cytochrome-c oxidase [Thioclava atlantica]
MQITPTLGLLLALSFVISLIALSILIWAIANRQVRTPDQDDARTIFAPGEGAEIDEHDKPHHFDPVRAGIDASSARPVLWLVGAAVFWLIYGSLHGLAASLELHLPDMMTGAAQMTFGRMRTVHLNSVAYGWASQAGLASVFWIIPRIFHTRLRHAGMVKTGIVLWNIGVAAGVAAIASGWTDGLEWLEIPWQIDIILAAGAACFVLPLIQTARARKVHHIYVSGWYFLAGILWFPVLFVIANIPGLHWGIEQATVNWWFAHNVLGLWLTPLGVGTAYYMIPKIIGKPVYSYAVSLVGFWALALFYSQVGIHHLIGGPVPTWLVTLSIVHSVMMFVPVIAVAINQHVTVARNLWAFKESVPLRFISLGALCYTLASFQGSIEALRSVNSITHFTHYTVGHAHLGAYAFVSLVMMGAIYQIVPRATGKQFPFPRMIMWHFWLNVIGFAVYFLSLTIGGVLQGLAMLDATKPFADSVTLLKPYLEGRSLGGGLMTLGHVLLAINLIALAFAKRETTETDNMVAAE